MISAGLIQTNPGPPVQQLPHWLQVKRRPSANQGSATSAVSRTVNFMIGIIASRRLEPVPGGGDNSGLNGEEHCDAGGDSHAAPAHGGFGALAADVELVLHGGNDEVGFETIDAVAGREANEGFAPAEGEDRIYELIGDEIGEIAGLPAARAEHGGSRPVSAGNGDNARLGSH